MGRGLIRYEDRSSHWNDPLKFPDAIELYCSMSIEGNWNVKTSGDYVFTLETGNVFWFFLDGKKILAKENDQDARKRTCKVFLNMGVHHVEIANDYISDARVPIINVLAPGSSAEMPLDDFALRGVLRGGSEESADKKSGPVKN